MSALSVIQYLLQTSSNLAAGIVFTLGYIAWGIAFADIQQRAGSASTQANHTRVEL
jgi:hypothetical protein